MKLARLPRVSWLVAAVALLVLATAISAQSTYEVYAIKTVAGLPGFAGPWDGTGSSARFNLPYGITCDGAGNQYVADTFNHTIRKVAPTGETSTIAGLNGMPGSSDGIGNAARFYAPYAIAADHTGNLYVTDTNNHTIRKIDSSGAVTTLAGSAFAGPGYSDGTGSAARFCYPNAIAVGSMGDVYVADTSNQVIRRITPEGVVTTIAGQPGVSGYENGTGSEARFMYPFGIAADGAGNIYVADTYSHRIRRVTEAGVVTTLAGGLSSGNQDGLGTAAKFNAPRGVAVDANGNVFVADEGNSTIRKISPAGRTTTLAGVSAATGSDDGNGPLARFNAAAGVAIDASGTLRIVDTANHTVRSGLPGPALPKLDLLDPSFSPGAFTNGQITHAILQPDGKLIIAGLFNKVHGVARHNIARLNADGTLDAGFDCGAGPNNGIGGILLQPDGKLIIFGVFARVDGIDRESSIARLNSDGSVDTSYDPGSTLLFDSNFQGPDGALEPGSVSGAVFQPDGRLVVVGSFSYVRTEGGTKIPRSGVTRFKSDGSFDSTFDPGEGFGYSQDPDYNETAPLFVACQKNAPNDGKLVVEGFFDNYDGHPVKSVVRLNANGGFDETFTSTAPEDANLVVGLITTHNDDILAFGYFSSFEGSPANGVVRLEKEGALDTTFQPLLADYSSSATVWTVAEQADGKLLLGGQFHFLDGLRANNIVRVQPNGQRDSSFDASEAAGTSCFNVRAIVAESEDNRIFVGGYFSTYDGEPRNNLAWVQQNGALAPTFEQFSGVTDYEPQVYALLAQPDGKVVVGGFFSQFQGGPHYNIVRLNADGTIDPDFNSAVQTEGSVRAMALQPNGKIIIAGNVRAVNGIPRRGIARLNSDGTLDTSFDPGLGADNTIYSVALDPTGNVYAVGAFENFNGIPRNRVAKLGSTGLLDGTFDPGTGANSNVYSVALADSGTILIGGSFSRYNGIAAGRIARLNRMTAAIDPAFNQGGSGFDSTVRVVTTRPDGSYFAAGSFSSYNGVSHLGVLRLKVNGAPDQNFVGTSLSQSILTLGFLGGGIIAGGQGAGFPIHLTSSGILDYSANYGSGIQNMPENAYYLPSPIVSAMALQPDGKLLVGGIFNQFNDTPHVCLVRLADPRVPGMKITSISKLNTSSARIIHLQGTGIPNAGYTLQASPDLVSEHFTDLVDFDLYEPGTWEFFEELPNPNPPKRFYRLIPR